MNSTLTAWLVIIFFIIFSIIKYCGKDIFKFLKERKQKKDDTRTQTKD
jgi:F0F1-type ATP synthase membrane subunit b/b'